MPITIAAALMWRRRPRRVAMIMMATQTMMQQSGTTTAREIPTITPAEIPKSAKQMKRYRVIHMHNGMDTEFAFIIIIYFYV